MSNLEKIEEAKQLIIEALQLADEVANDTNNSSHFSAYGKYGFDQLLGNGNKYDSSLDNLLD
tara:strand:- start:1478 stop:1663 length:186 start_codon:yes stop_codon:yes gene_type:complete